MDKQLMTQEKINSSPLTFLCDKAPADQS
jgi:hypothetical protein